VLEVARERNNLLEEMVTPRVSCLQETIREHHLIPIHPIGALAMPVNFTTPPKAFSTWARYPEKKGESGL